MATAWLVCNADGFALNRMLRCVHDVIRVNTGHGYPRGSRNDLLALQHNDITATHIRVDDDVQAMIAAEIAAPSGAIGPGELATLTYVYDHRIASPPDGVVQPIRLDWTGGDYMLVVLIGQSNSCAQHEYTITDAPTEERGELLGSLGNWFVFNGGLASTPGWRRTQPPLFNDTGLRAGSCGVAMVAHLLQTIPRVAYLHYGAGGTAVGTDWVPGGSTRSEFDAFLRSGVASFPHPITSAAIVMGNGESDCATTALANAHQANLTELTASIRSAIGFPTARLVIHGLDPNLASGGSWPYTSEVMAAQSAMVAADINARLVSGVGFLDGGVIPHATFAEARAFGIAAADAITGT